jgi:hypothetical protein
MEIALKEILKIYISPFLKTNGFKKKGNSFYKKQNDLTYSISFPVDREYTENGAYFYMNCGIYSDAFEQLMGRAIKDFPKGYDNIHSVNFADITTSKNDRFLLETTTDFNVLSNEIKENIVKILTFFEKINNLETLMNHCLEHNFLVHYEDLMRYLAILKDDEKTQNYLLKIKEKLYSISDKALFFYTKKMQDLKAEYS